LKRRTMLFAAGAALCSASERVWAAEEKKKWWLGTCGKCGYKSAKIYWRGQPDPYECHTLLDNGRRKCGGLVVYSECGPPG
jgi:hypothetical protein